LDLFVGKMPVRGRRKYTGGTGFALAVFAESIVRFTIP